MRRVPSRFARHLALLAALAVCPAVQAAADAQAAEQPPVVERPEEEAKPRGRIQMRQMQPQAGPAAAVRREPYLGVVAGPVAEQLRAHLALPEGVGLVVEEATKEGPAARGGIGKFDILLKFGDQLICNAEQLAALVKAAGKGEEVVFTVVRGGKEMVVTVLIDERDVEVDEPATPAAGLGVNPLAENPFAQNPFGPAFPMFPGFPGGLSQRVVAHADQRGAVEIRETDGRRTVTVRDPTGRQVHAGPLDTDADRRRIPAAFRALVGEVETRLGGKAKPPGNLRKRPAADGEI